MGMETPREITCHEELVDKGEFTALALGKIGGCDGRRPPPTPQVYEHRGKTFSFRENRATFCLTKEIFPNK